MEIIIFALGIFGIPARSCKDFISQQLDNINLQSLLSNHKNTNAKPQDNNL